MNETLTPAHQLPAGTLLGEKYKIVRTLGDGGFCIAYMGSNTSSDTPAAIGACSHYRSALRYVINSLQNQRYVKNNAGVSGNVPL